MAVAARQPMRRALASTDLRWALGLGFLALALRLGFVLAFGRTQTFNPGAGFAFSDTLFYNWVGAALSQGQGFTFLGHQSAHWAPGYPVLLAAVYKLFGADARNALIANAVLGALTVPLVYLIGVALAETFYVLELAAFLALAIVLGRRPWSSWCSA